MSPRLTGRRVIILFFVSLNRFVIESISLSYIPSIAATDPPEKPGMINAAPIHTPKRKSRGKVK